MNASDIKLEIFWHIDSFGKDCLEEVFGILVKYLNDKMDLDDYQNLTQEHQQGIVDAIKELIQTKELYVKK